ncbi:MAG: FG-GAP-like repeat-containing protein [Flavobacteriales bacterium]
MLRALGQRVLLAALCTALCWATTSAQSFVDATADFGLSGFSDGYNGSGITAVDFNLDGWDDLAICTPSETVRLFQNNTDGTFQEIDAFDAFTEARMVSFVDVDSDHDLDVFVTCYLAPNRLFRNDAGTYVDVTEGSGIWTISDPSYGHCWGDVNADGYLDLYVANYAGNDIEETENALYLSNGDFTFEEVAASWGADDGIRASFMPTFFDADDDGHLDLFVINDRILYPNTLFLNSSNDSLEDVTFDWNIPDYICAMSNTVGDPNHDGKHDLYVTNVADGNLLYINNGTGVNEQAGAWGAELNRFSWGSVWGDWDNDRWQDLAVCHDHNPGQNAYGGTTLLRNQLAGSFNEVTSSPTAAESSTNYSVATGDFDNDGRLDLVTLGEAPTGIKLWLNNYPPRNFTKVLLHSEGPNCMGVGARVEVWSGEHRQLQTSAVGSGYLSQNSYTLHFGLDDTQQVDYLRVAWPNGTVDRWFGLPANQLTTIEQGTAPQLTIAFEGSGVVCPGVPVLLAVTPNPGYPVVWSDGATGAERLVSEAGVYTAEVLLPGGEVLELEPLTLLDGEGDWTLEVTLPGCYPDTTAQVALAGPDSAAIAAFNPDFAPLMAGVQTLEVATPWGCVVLQDIDVPERLPLQLEIVATAPLCFGDANGQLAITPSGNGPFELAVTPGTENLPAGPVYLSLTDANGCALDSTFTLTEPPELLGSLITEGVNDSGVGLLELAVEGGSPPYTYAWNGEVGTAEFPVLEPQEVVWVIIDDQGCISEGEYLITAIDERGGSSFAAFPNPAFKRMHLKGPVGSTCQLRDAQGRILIQLTIDAGQQELEVDHLAAGTYLLCFYHPSSGSKQVRVQVR